MKITLICYDYLPNIGGITQYGYNLAKAVAELGHEVTVLASPVDGMPEEQKTDGFTTLRRRWMASPKATNRFLSIFAKIGAQVRGIPGVLRDPEIRNADRVLFTNLNWYPAVVLSFTKTRYSQLLHG